MSAVLRPSEPPVAREARAKHLPPRTVEASHPAECKRVNDGDARAVEILNRVLRSRGTSTTELAEVVGFPEKQLRAIRSRDRRRPFKVGHLFAFDKRTALAIWNEIHVELLTGTHEE